MKRMKHFCVLIFSNVKIIYIHIKDKSPFNKLKRTISKNEKYSETGRFCPDITSGAGTEPETALDILDPVDFY